MSIFGQCLHCTSVAKHALGARLLRTTDLAPIIHFASESLMEIVDPDQMLLPTLCRFLSYPRALMVMMHIWRSLQLDR